MTATIIPKPVAGFDVRRLPLTAAEGFVLSRLDGHTSLGDVASLTGIAADETVRIAHKLADLGAIVVPGYTPQHVSGTRPATPEPAPTRPHPSDLVDDATLDPVLLGEANDLDLVTRRRILATHRVLDEVDHYALLGVSRRADRKAIKAAFYVLAATFHTDRHFGKNLGSFRHLMEAIFIRLNHAHDTLTTANKRTTYDTTLPPENDEEMLDDEGPIALVAEEKPVDPGAVRRIASSPQLSAQTPEKPAAKPTSSVSTSSMGAANPSEQERLRREALARKLGGSTRRFPAQSTTPFPGAASTLPPRRPSPMPGSAAPPPRAGATPLPPRATTAGPAPMHAPLPPGTTPVPPRTTTPLPPRPAGSGTGSGVVRRSLDPIAIAARQAEVEKLVAGGRAAFEKKDLFEAERLYKLAAQATDDPTVHAIANDVQRRARAAMADTLVAEARKHESQQSWGMAAISWLRALDARPDSAELAERASNALRSAGTDLKRAVRLAEQAVQADPQNARYRATAGHAYLDAGLFLRARSELEHAARLLPHDTQVKELLARARKAAS